MGKCRQIKKHYCGVALFTTIITRLQPPGVVVFLRRISAEVGAEVGNGVGWCEVRSFWTDS